MGGAPGRRSGPQAAGSGLRGTGPPAARPPIAGMQGRGAGARTARPRTARSGDSPGPQEQNQCRSRAGLRRIRRTLPGTEPRRSFLFPEKAGDGQDRPGRPGSAGAGRTGPRGRPGRACLRALPPERLMGSFPGRAGRQRKPGPRRGEPERGRQGKTGIGSPLLPAVGRPAGPPSTAGRADRSMENDYKFRK